MLSRAVVPERGSAVAVGAALELVLRAPAPWRAATARRRAARASARCEAHAIASSRSSRSGLARDERQRLDRLRRRAHERDEPAVAGFRDDCAVPDGDRVDGVPSLDDLPAPDGYRDRLSHEDGTLVPEFPEMEAWRRQLDDPVSAFPIAKAGPGAHRDAEDLRPAARGAGRPPLRGRRAAREAAPVPDRRRRARPALPPHDRRTPQVPAAGREGPEDAGVPARVPGRLAARSHRGGLEEARRRVAALRPSRPRRSSRTSARRRSGSAPSGSRRSRERVAPSALHAPRPARDRRDRARVGQRDPSPRRALAVRADERSRRRGDLPARGGDRRRARAAASSCASAERTTRRRTACTTSSPSHATSAARRSRAWTSRSTRSTTARPARPEGRILKDRRLSRLLR